MSSSASPAHTAPKAPSDSDTEPISEALSCRGLRVSYRGREVLHGIDLGLREGEWLGLIGPNGAGKSTLLRSIIGLTKHDGTVMLSSGESPTSTDIALVPQSPLLPEGMTVAEYVLLGRTAHLGWLGRESRRDREVVASVLRRLDLQSFAPRLVTALSGGEAQRVVVARAFAQQNPILLLDEPTSSLDLGRQASVLELVDDLRRADGLSVIAAMHDLSTAARFSDRLALMDHGQIVASGSAAEVLQPELLSRIYATSLNVRTIDNELFVLPGRRRSPERRESQQPPAR